jgi:hypothetical protein
MGHRSSRQLSSLVQGAGRDAGTVKIGDKPIDLKADYIVAYAILGMQRFRTCSAVAIVTAAQEVAVLNSHPVYKVTGTAVLSADGKPPKDKHDARYVLQHTLFHPQS